jgi:hypothetical protein
VSCSSTTESATGATGFGSYTSTAQGALTSSRRARLPIRDRIRLEGNPATAKAHLDMTVAKAANIPDSPPRSTRGKSGHAMLRRRQGQLRASLLRQIRTRHA